VYEEKKRWKSTCSHLKNKINWGGGYPRRRGCLHGRECLPMRGAERSHPVIIIDDWKEKDEEEKVVYFNPGPVYLNNVDTDEYVAFMIEFLYPSAGRSGTSHLHGGGRGRKKGEGGGGDGREEVMVEEKEKAQEKEDEKEVKFILYNLSFF